MNGNGKIEGLLERIAASSERTAEHVERLEERVDRIAASTERLEARVERLAVGQDLLRQDMNRGFAQLNARIDNVLVIAGGHHDDHEHRIQVLEAQVLGKQGAP